MTALTSPNQVRTGAFMALIASPAIIIFLSSNIVNVGNLAFNMIFSRWMGPEMFGDLAVVLTIKLALLGVLGALSSAVSHRTAAETAQDAAQSEQALARINRICFGGLWLALPVVALAIYAGSIDTRLDISSPYLLYILIGSLPFSAPLSILRGVALGQMNSAKVVLSANVEMVVRLGGAVLAWKAGLGLEGVVAAIGLSIIAGWIVLLDVLPAPKTPKTADVPVKRIAVQLGLAALPFALLQLAQVASLDGDIFLATRYLNDTETGYVAALTLFQRIQFFACFALASVLLPAVVAAQRDGTSYHTQVMMIAVLLCAVSAVVIGASAFAPELLLSLLVGETFAPAAVHLMPVAIAAVVFTVNYLIAVFLLAQGSRVGVIHVLGGSVLQIALMSVVLADPAGDLAAMLTIKVVCQFAILVLLLIHLTTLSPNPQTKS